MKNKITGIVKDIPRLIGAIGALLAIIFAFTSVYKVTASFMGVSSTEYGGFFSNEISEGASKVLPILVVVFSAVALVGLLVDQKIISISGSGLAMILLIIEVLRVKGEATKALDAMSSFGIDLSGALQFGLGYGGWFMIIGLALAIIASVAMFVKKKK